MAFISKFALSRGVFEVPDGAVETDGSYWHNPSGKAGWGTHVSATHVHDTREMATAKAEKMRAAKIASHEKHIAGLRALNFTPSPIPPRAGAEPRP